MQHCCVAWRHNVRVVHAERKLHALAASHNSAQRVCVQIHTECAGTACLYMQFMFSDALRLMHTEHMVVSWQQQ